MQYIEVILFLSHFFLHTTLFLCSHHILLVWLAPSHYISSKAERKKNHARLKIFYEAQQNTKFFNV